MAAGQPGSVIAGRYTLREELGRGGMGVVWRAWDEVLAREVAVKEVLVPDQLSETEREQAHARIRREAQTAARVSHPAVVTVHDVLDHGGHPWVVMEFISGHSLQERIATSGPVSPELGAEIAASILRALRAAHAVGVAHRDVKPGNIMLTGDGRVVLTDFGIAVVEGGATITSTGTLVGSPEYMAPERMAEDPDPHASDLWSLGATLFAAVEGDSPFRRESLTETITAVVAAPVPVPRRAGPLTDVIMGLLERDLSRRLRADQALDLLASPAPASPSPERAPSGPNIPPHWSPTGGRVTGPHPAPQPSPPPASPGYITGPSPMAPPSENRPSGTSPQPGPSTVPPQGGYITGPRPMPPPAGQQQWWQHGPGGAAHNAYAAPALPARRERPRWVLPALVGGAASVVLVLVAVTAWVILRPDPIDYQYHQDEDFALSYPAGWEVEDYGEEDMVNEVVRGLRFWDPSRDLLIAVEHFGAIGNTSSQELQFVEQHIEENFHDYQRVELSRGNNTDVPETWDVAFYEAEYTASEWHTPDRNYQQIVIIVEESDGYSISVNVPADGGHQRMQEEILASFEPQL